MFVSYFLTECPEGYEAGFENHCYFYQESPSSFTEARSLCLATNNSDLVIIDTPAELDFLLNKSQEFNFNGDAKVWIGKRRFFSLNFSILD